MKLECTILGLTPLIIHNGQTADPLNSFSKRMKAITSKRKKTEEDIKELLDIQWESSLYWNDKLGVYMPCENMLAALLKACKKHKMGPQISGFVFEEPLGFPILCENSKNMALFKKDETHRFVKAVTIQRSKTISCRCIFPTWKIDWNCIIDEDIISPSDVKVVLNTLSSRIGLGVWTPSHPKPGTYGKFLYDRISFINEKTGKIQEEFKL